MSGLSQSAGSNEALSQHDLVSQTLLRVDEDEASQMEQYMKNLVNKTLTRFMLRSVEQVRLHQTENTDKFPVSCTHPTYNEACHVLIYVYIYSIMCVCIQC